VPEIDRSLLIARAGGLFAYSNVVRSSSRRGGLFPVAITIFDELRAGVYAYRSGSSEPRAFVKRAFRNDIQVRSIQIRSSINRDRDPSATSATLLSLSPGPADLFENVEKCRAGSPMRKIAVSILSR